MCVEFKLFIIAGKLCDGEMMMGLMVLAWAAVGVAFIYERMSKDDD